MTSVGGHFTQTSSNIYYDSGKVGIGTDNPVNKLDVVGDVNITGKYKIGGNDLQYIDLSNLPEDFDTSLSNVVDGTTIKYTNGTLTVIGGGGGDSEWTISDNKIYYNDGNVGIGTTDPSTKLDVVGNINITGTYKINGYAIDTDDIIEGSNKYYSDTLV